MSEIEAAADVATGAIVARGIEPGHGEDDGHTHESACLNCAAPLTGPYCAMCGQQAHVHRTLTALWHDIAHGVFHFEGKVWRTLPMLAWRPGEVTRRYIHGERARFVSPLALFLFSVFLMFAVFGSVGGPIVPTATEMNVRGAKVDVAAELVRARTLVMQLEARRQTEGAQGKPRTATDRALRAARDDVAGLEAAIQLGDAVVVDNPLEDFKIDTGSQEFDDHVRAAISNPKLLLYKIQSSAYKFAWALVPLSLPFMWAMFAWRREYRVYDHAVFVTYSLSFVVLLLVAMALVAAIGAPSEWLLVLVPIHFFRQLKQAYRLGTRGALWRTLMLLATAGVVMLIFAALLLALGLSG